jgi:hypothetical protein
MAPGYKDDFIPQNVPASEEAPAGRQHGVEEH